MLALHEADTKHAQSLLDELKARELMKKMCLGVRRILERNDGVARVLLTVFHVARQQNIDRKTVESAAYDVSGHNTCDENSASELLLVIDAMRRAIEGNGRSDILTTSAMSSSQERFNIYIRIMTSCITRLQSTMKVGKFGSALLDALHVQEFTSEDTINLVDLATMDNDPCARGLCRVITETLTQVHELTDEQAHEFALVLERKTNQLILPYSPTSP